MSGTDRYEIRSEIGRGESGVVYQAHDRLTGRPVAIKAFRRRAGGAGIEDLARRLSREADLLSRVRHPCIVEIIETRLTGDGAWLVTEFVEGETLQETLRRRESLHPGEVVALIAQAARALSHAHARGVVHRDIKPANLLITPGGQLKITDFGVAGDVRDDDATERDGGYFLGTPAYVAPEQWLGQPVDGRADLYSLGVVLYRCLTGRRPFEGRSVREVVYRSLHETPRPPSRHRAGVPAELDRICLRALSREPSGRFGSGEEMATALEKIVVEEPLVGTEPTPPAWLEDPMERTWSRLPVHRRRGWRGWLVGSVAAAAVLAAFVIVAGRGDAAGEVALDIGTTVAPPLRIVAVEARDSLGTAARDDSTPPPALGAQSSGAAPKTSAQPDEERFRTPDGDLLARYARRAVDQRSRPRGARAESTERPASRETPAAPREVRNPLPRAASEIVASDDAEAQRSEPVSAGVDLAPMPRAALRLHHDLEEGLVEILVNGRRAALERVRGPQEASSPLEIDFRLLEGAQSVEVRVMSASAGLEAATTFELIGKTGRTLQPELGLEQSRRGWRLIGR